MAVHLMYLSDLTPGCRLTRAVDQLERTELISLDSLKQIHPVRFISIRDDFDGVV